MPDAQLPGEPHQPFGERDARGLFARQRFCLGHRLVEIHRHHGSEQIVDARSAARFTGAEPDPRPGVAPGHMPGARNLPYTQLFEADGTWKQGEALADAFAAAGVSTDRPMAMTCGSGITASVLAFGAHLLGSDAAVYDGSWTEWGGDPTTPKATGDA